MLFCCVWITTAPQLSLADFFRTASTIGERDGTQVEMILFAGFVYFVISLAASALVSYLKKRTV